MWALVYSPRFQDHDPGQNHPEAPWRSEAVVRFLTAGPLASEMTLVAPSLASFAWLKAVHEESYLMAFEEACLRLKSHFHGGDNGICFDTFEVARLAAGAVIRAVDLVENEGYSVVFCPVRPPGHHAGPARAQGFCFLNNVAIGVRYWQRNYSPKRILILDWDAHHGNGLQEIFYREKEVFYISFHEDPRLSFPGTGLAVERGAGAGRGYTLNLPLKMGTGDREYLKLLREVISPQVAAFSPQGIIIAAGFDAHRDDDFSFLNLTSQGFKALAAEVRAWSEKFSAPVISVLEGGYEPGALLASAEAHLCGLLGH